MAILTLAELQLQRNECEKSGVQINYNKSQVNAALQAIEAVMTSTALKTAINNAVNTATEPLVLTAAQKLELVKAVVRRLNERWS